MPGIDESPQQWRYRVNDPSRYKRMRYGKDVFGEGIDVIWGVTDDGRAEVQALRFNKDKFKDKKSVQDWIKKHQSELRQMKANEIEWSSFLSSYKYNELTGLSL